MEKRNSHTEKYYRASEIFSHPATGSRPARRGILPISRTKFYDLLKEGRIPAADGKVGATRLWSGSLLHASIITTGATEPVTAD